MRIPTSRSAGSGPPDEDGLPREPVEEPVTPRKGREHPRHQAAVPTIVPQRADVSQRSTEPAAPPLAQFAPESSMEAGRARRAGPIRLRHPILALATEPVPPSHGDARAGCRFVKPACLDWRRGTHGPQSNGAARGDVHDLARVAGRGRRRPGRAPPRRRRRLRRGGADRALRRRRPNRRVAWLEQVDVGDDPFALDEIFDAPPAGEDAARAALDHALHDLQGKLLGQPVYKLLGLRRAGPPTSWTIWLGDPDDMARRTERILDRGFRRLKLKLGGRDGLDAERVRAVQSVTDLPLQCDVNEAWTLEEALDYLPQLTTLQYCEQPLVAGDPDGPELKRRSPVPIYVDEDCHSLGDVAACAERAHGINIKLAKAGGIRESVRMVHAARALGLGVMLGCMVESGLGHRARRAHREPDGSRRPRRKPAARVRPVAGSRVHRRRAASRPTSRGSALRPRRLLVLAEGRSGDPHFGKTARGVIRYRPRATSSPSSIRRAAPTEHEGFPLVNTVADALQYEPTTALVGVATQGGRFPPAWRALLEECIRAGLDVENGLHEFLSRRRRSSPPWPPSTASSCATCGRRRRASTSRPART